MPVMAPPLNVHALLAAAREALESEDFVYLHVEAPDEAGHNGEADQKVLAVERIDEMIVGPVARRIDEGAEMRVLVAPDHYTPVVKRTHSREPVPYLMAVAWCRLW